MPAHGFLIVARDGKSITVALAYLDRLPIAELKIDRSSVLAMEHSGSAAVMIVRSVMVLASDRAAVGAGRP